MILPNNFEEFDQWLLNMDEDKKKFFKLYPELISLLDLSVDSLDILGKFLLSKYGFSDLDQLMETNDPEDEVTFRFVIFYIGETYRKYLDGEWDFAVFPKEEMRIGHKRPVIIRRNYEYVFTSYSHIIPSSLMWTFLDRKEENLLSSILEAKIKSFNEWNDKFGHL